MALNFSNLKQTSIVDYLSTMGFDPHRIRGNNYWYYSPFRNESQPSFKVDDRLNVWYDHGTGEGGTILDLGARLYQCSIHEFALKLAGTSPPERFFASRIPQKQPDNKILIQRVRKLQSPWLITYLQSRGLKKSIAEVYCSEVDFGIGTRNYTAVGFQNRSGGWEFRNASLKLSSSPKDISFIQRGSTRLCIVEGFSDFLSALSIEGPNFKSLTNNASFLILNSVSFVKRSMEVMHGYESIVALLDNDDAGRKAIATLESEGIKFENCAGLYSGYKDLNDFLVAKSEITSTFTRPRGFSI